MPEVKIAFSLTAGVMAVYHGYHDWGSRSRISMLFHLLKQPSADEVFVLNSPVSGVEEAKETVEKGFKHLQSLEKWDKNYIGTKRPGKSPTGMRLYGLRRGIIEGWNRFRR